MTSVPETFAKIPKVFCWTSENKKNLISFQKKLLKTFIRLLRMQSWRPCGTFSADHLKFFNSEVTKMNKRTTSTEKKFLLKLFAWTGEMQSDQLCWNIFAKFLEKIGWKSKTISKNIYIYIYIFSKKSFFFQNVPLDTQTAFLTSKPQIFRQKLDNCLRTKSKKDKKYNFLQENPQSVPLETSNAVSTSLRIIFRQNLDT